MTRRTARPTLRTVREDLPDGWGNAYPKHAIDRGDPQEAMPLASLDHLILSLPVCPDCSAVYAETTYRVSGCPRPETQSHSPQPTITLTRPRIASTRQPQQARLALWVRSSVAT